MADRDSACIFGMIFEHLLTTEKSDTPTEVTRKFWKASWNYDFSPCQMECDEALIKLGLARETIHPKYNEPWIQYRASDGKRWEAP